MNKSALRNFAVWARRDLIKRISDRANLLGVYEDKPTKEIQATTEKGFVVNGVTFNYKKDIRDAFVKRVQELGYQDAIEEIAYTWFNRIIALRFMEVNGYLTNGKNGEKIYVIGSTVDGKNEPDALTNADKLSFVDKFTVYDYQDANDNNGLYRYILTKQCNDLNKAMPLMFEEIEDYAELLLPDHLLDKGAIIDHLVNDISAKDFNITIKDNDGENASQVEIVGWLYQFYISEKKEDVFAGLKNNTKITKGTLPAATQIFTPDWIVRYMTDNTLGKMWVESRNSNLKKELKYYLEPAEQTDEVKAKLAEINKQYAEKRVTDITFIDPCCGSGHILVYAFDLFYKMYLESGYVSNEIPSLILKNNLVGIDVDKRAVQLTSFALTMKALSYDKDFLTKQVYPNVIDMKESNSLNQNEVKEFIALSRLSNEDDEVVEEVIEKFKDAELYGSLIKDFRYSPERYDVVLKYIHNNVDPDAIFNLVDRVAIINTKPLICDLLKEAIILSSKYDVVVTNPPYAGNAKLPDVVGKYLQAFYPNTKSDLFSAFIERNMEYSTTNGNIGIMCPYVWMFIQSYEKLRQEIINTKALTSLVQLEYGGFAEAVVPICTFTFRNTKTNETGEFIRLEQFKGPDLQGPKTLDAVKNRNCGFRYTSSSENIKLVPSLMIVYWLSQKTYESFKLDKISKYISPRIGLVTGDTERFIKYWPEVNYNKVNFNCSSNEETKNSVFKWFPYQKGGAYRKWFGNNDYLVNWQNDGYEQKYDNFSKGKVKSHNYNGDYAFKQAITWTKISSSKFACRKVLDGYMFDDAGPICSVNKDELDYMLGILNSKVGEFYLSILSPTMNILPGHINQLPVFNKLIEYEVITKIVSNLVNLSEQDWDQYETSWDFEKNPLIEISNSIWDATGIGATMFEYYGKHIATSSPLELCYLLYKGQTNERFDILKANEEELNKIFIEIYDLKEELTPEVADRDITVARIYDTKNEIPEEMKNNIYVKTKQDVVKDLISYIVGCAFGRYSPYKDGLIFAGGEFNYDEYLEITHSLEQPLIHNGLQNYAKSFMPSEENCIMITDNDYGTNNLVDYVVDFVRKVYTSECLEENLKFIANALNEKSTDTPHNVIREYLANDFFKDHCKKYQNRPIYWQFDSGKNGGFRALMYLHRYDENTIPTARLSYLHDIQWKYEQEKDRLEKLIENSTITSEKTKARKELDLIEKQILECKAYDEVLNHAANMRISIDLDDGVKVNYQKFQKLDGDKDKNILSTYLKFKDKE